MISDHRPYYFKRLQAWIEASFTRHFLAPQLTALGDHYRFMKPWHIRIFGDQISIGDHGHIVADKDRKVSLSTWIFDVHKGCIEIGHRCLICPGVRIESASKIKIHDDCMMAAGVYITDADWHDIYDRTRPVGQTKPVELLNNVWIGDGATICKGVTIGENSIVGAGAVVVADIPPNSIAAGNPARVVKQLDPSEIMVTRQSIFADPVELAASMDRLNRYLSGNSTMLGWLRVKLFPRRGD